MKKPGRGVRKQLALARRALRVAITHLHIARQGLRLEGYANATALRNSWLVDVDLLADLGAPLRNYVLTDKRSK